MGEADGFETGGDPVCWLPLVCDDCGAIREGAACPRCGATPAAG